VGSFGGLHALEVNPRSVVELDRLLVAFEFQSEVLKARFGDVNLAVFRQPAQSIGVPTAVIRVDAPNGLNGRSDLIPCRYDVWEVK